MAAPVITFTDATTSIITSLAFGNVDSSSTSSPVQILVWNNLAGSQTLSNATNVTLTTKTYNGLDTGDTVSNGQEIVSYTMLGVQCISEGVSTPIRVGGPTTTIIGSALGTSINYGTILGIPGGDAAVCNLTLTAPPNVTAGPVQFLIRCNYLYS